MSKSKRTAQQRSLDLRALLGCGPTHRTVEAARKVVAERDQLRQRVADLEVALAAAWAENAEEEQRQADLAKSSDSYHAHVESEARREALHNARVHGSERF